MEVSFISQREKELSEIAAALRQLNKLNKTFEKALIAFEQSQVSIAVFKEVTEEFPQSLDRIERLLLVLVDLLKDQIKNKKATNELRSGLIKSRRHSLMRQISQVQANINEREELKADYGIDVPVHLINEIKKLKKLLDGLREEYEFFTEMEASD